MSRKQFYQSSDRIYISSYRKTNIRSLAEHCIHDINRLNMYIHKLMQLRLQVLRYNFVFFLRNTPTPTLHCCVTNTTLLLHFLCFFFSYSTFFTLHNLPHQYNMFHFFFFYKKNIVDSGLLLYRTYSTFLFSYAFSFSFFRFSLFYKKGLVSLPTKIRKYTVLRSPHTDKKSREQFERRTHKKVYVFPSMLSDYYLFLCTKHYVFFGCTLVYEYNTLCIE